jgi:hypothetical protein
MSRDLFDVYERLNMKFGLKQTDEEDGKGEDEHVTYSEDWDRWRR